MSEVGGISEADRHGTGAGHPGRRAAPRQPHAVPHDDVRLADEETRLALERLLGDPETGIFRGPYLRIRTPFHSADDGWRAALEWQPSFTPWWHQAKAWKRLGTYEGRRSRLSGTPCNAETRSCSRWPGHRVRVRLGRDHGVYSHMRWGL